MASPGTAPGELVKIRGPGLNTITLPNRAREVLGRNWESETLLVSVIAVKRGGVLQVQLPNGTDALVSPEWVTGDDSEGESEEGEPTEGAQPDIELGSDPEPEDMEPEDEGVEEDSASRQGCIEEPEDWLPTIIDVDERIKDGHAPPRKGRILDLEGPLLDRVWPYFWKFMPGDELDEAIEIMDRKGRERWGQEWATLDRNKFCQWLGLWFRQCTEQSRTRRSYWQGVSSYGFKFTEVMSWETFSRITTVLELPQYDTHDTCKVADMGEGPHKMGWLRKWLHGCNLAPRAAWEPGTFVTIDETMVFWTGMGEVPTAKSGTGPS